MKRAWCWAIFVGLVVLLLPSAAAAQNSAIAGTVTDPSGAAVPGVTVDVSSPALIEGTKTTTTNEIGRYQVLSLRPGLYSVTFRMDGFRTIKRDNIELTDNFTAPVNAQLEVGARSEEITVSAATPFVDVVNLANPQTISTDMMLALPLGARSTAEILSAIPGVAAGALGTLTYRGSGDTLLTIDGNRATFLNAFAGPGGTTLGLSASAYEEYSLTTSIDSVDSGQSGMRVNVVPKDGGNRFSALVFTIFQGDKWRSNNIDEKYTQPPYNANSFTLGAGTKRQFDFNPTFGGPIIKNRLWHQETFRRGVNESNVLNFYQDKNPNPQIFEADLTKPETTFNNFYSGGTRITYQASAKDKIAGNYDDQARLVPYGFFRSSADPAGNTRYKETHDLQIGGKWTRTQTSRLLIEVQGSHYYQDLSDNFRGDAEIWNPFNGSAEPGYVRTTPTPAMSSYTPNLTFNTTNQPAEANLGESRTYTSRAEATYLRGAHTLRMGGTWFGGSDLSQFRRVNDTSYTINLVTNPVTGVVSATSNSLTAVLPTNVITHIDADIGLWFQDQWAYKRFTTKVGVRYDNLRTSYPDQTQPDSPWLAEQHIEGNSALNWKDVTPRISTVWDIFGNGKTAVKGGVARFVNGETVTLTRALNPNNLISRTATATWTDLDLNQTLFNPDGSVQYSEINNGTALEGKFQSTSFGQPIFTTEYDSDVLSGWYKRGYTWETNVGVDHQLLPRLSTSLTYYHRTEGNQRATDNRNIDGSAENYTGPFCLRAPTNPNLPDGGGYDVCGLYDVTTLGSQRLALPTSVVGNVGTPANYITFRENLGNKRGQILLTDGFEISLNGRLPRGAFLQGGMDFRSTLTDNCDLAAIDQPQQQFCRNRTTWNFAPRISGAYALPEIEKLGFAKDAVEGIQISGIYRANRSPNVTASWTACERITATNGCFNSDFNDSAAAGVTPVLGRPLTATSGTKVIALIEPNKEWQPYVNIFDMRFSKIFNVDRYRFTFSVDMYNMFNNGAATAINTTYGLTGTPEASRQWLRPTTLSAPRSYRVGGNFQF